MPEPNEIREQYVISDKLRLLRCMPRDEKTHFLIGVVVSEDWQYRKLSHEEAITLWATLQEFMS